MGVACSYSSPPDLCHGMGASLTKITLNVSFRLVITVRYEAKHSSVQLVTANDIVFNNCYGVGYQN